jgi:salicylate hydroxylase
MILHRSLEAIGDGIVADQPVIIAGAGIGGLTTALALARLGMRSIVLERAPVIAEIGAGIQLGPNAFHVFDTLGIGEAARSTAVFVDRLRLMDAVSAEEICALELDEHFLRRFGNTYAVVHRAELHAMIMRECQASGLVDLRTSAEVLDYEREGATVVAILASGERVRGQALVGADGLWSRIRARIVGDGPPRVSGHTTYRSVIPFEEMPADVRWNAMTLWAGPKCHIVHYPLSGAKLFNLVVTYHNDALEPVAGQPASHAEVLLGFEHVHEMAQQVIRIGKDWKKWVLCDREPSSNWTDGNVTLLGDAAHPTMQYLAQGACMAMEDGVVLAAEIAASPGDVEKALQSYQSRRMLRTARVVLQSRQVGDHILHSSGVHADLRNQMMRAKSQQDLCDVLDWLYAPIDLGTSINR